MVKAKKRWAKRIAAVALACALGTGAASMPTSILSPCWLSPPKW